MPMRSVLAPVLVIVGVSMAVPALAVDAASAKKIPVELWFVGDDVLSLRVRDAVENAFKSSPDFIFSEGKKPGTLVVTIPENAGWQRIGGRTRVLYKVEFASSANQKIGARNGSCWENAVGNCAAQIVRDAKIAARKIH